MIKVINKKYRKQERKINVPVDKKEVVEKILPLVSEPVVTVSEKKEKNSKKTNNTTEKNK